MPNFMSKSFINLNHTILILLSLLLTSCERKVESKAEPIDSYELKIDGEKQKLNADEILKLQSYTRSICKISESFGVKVNRDKLTSSTSTNFDDLEKKPPEEMVEISTRTSLEFNKKEFQIKMERWLLEENIKGITIKDTYALNEIFLLFEKKKSGWSNINFYSSDTSSFENLKNFKEYFYTTTHFERSNVVCVRHLVAKNDGSTSGE